jgi:hypothetical protein
LLSVSRHASFEKFLFDSQLGPTEPPSNSAILEESSYRETMDARKGTQMTDTARQRLLPRTIVAGALALGLIGGGYGIASAASGTEATPSSNAAAQSTTTLPSVIAAASSGQEGWGGQRTDETLLTGDALSSVTAAAKAKVPGGTIVRVETDADGNAAYEAHMTAADGSRTTVYVDKSFNVVSVDSH